MDSRNAIRDIQERIRKAQKIRDELTKKMIKCRETEDFKTWGHLWQQSSDHLSKIQGMMEALTIVECHSEKPPCQEPEAQLEFFEAS